MNIKRTMLVLVFGAMLLATSPAWAGDGLDKGRQALEAGRIDEAVQVLNRALETGRLSDRERALAFYLRGQAYEQKGYFGDAEQDYGRALALAGYDPVYFESFRSMRRRNAPGPP